MSSTTTPDRATTSTGIALPLMALPRKRPETADERDIPLVKDTVGSGTHLPDMRLDFDHNGWFALMTFAPGASLALHYHTAPRRGLHTGLQRIIEGLTTLPVRGIATIGPALDPTRFRATSNVSIASAATHSAILRHAGVVVTHGGSDRPSLVWLREPSHVSRLRKGECPYDVLRYQLG